MRLPLHRIWSVLRDRKGNPTNEPNCDSGYLEYRRARENARGGPGLNHWKCNLAILLEEASRLGRVAVLPELYLPKKHNWGNCRRTYFEKYIDFSTIVPQVEIVSNAEFQHFDIRSSNRIDETVTTEELKNNCSQLLTRDFPHWRWYEMERKFRSNPGGEIQALRSNHDRPMHQFIRPSARILRLSSEVVSELGSYGAIHIRRGDKFAKPDRFPELQKYTAIDHVLQTIRAGIDCKLPLFIMSNEDSNVYFAPIENEFRSFRYTAFPRLAEIRDIEKDSFLLYAVEQEIFKRAAVKISTYRNRPPSDISLVP